MAKKHATVKVLTYGRFGSLETTHRAPTLRQALTLAAIRHGFAGAAITWGRCKVLPSGNLAGGDGYYRAPGDTRDVYALPSIYWMAVRTNPRGWRPARICRRQWDETAHIRAAGA